MAKPISNDQALTAMANAERLLLEAYQNFLAMRQSIAASKESVEEANDTSINRDCPQYQAIAARFQEAFEGLASGVYEMEAAFKNQIINHMIQRGSIEQEGEAEQTEA